MELIDVLWILYTLTAIPVAYLIISKQKKDKAADKERRANEIPYCRLSIEPMRADLDEYVDKMLDEKF